MPAPLSSLAPARRRLLLGVLALAFVAVLVIATLVGSRDSRRDARPAVSQAVAGPVVLVPGYGGSRQSLDAVAARLRTALRQVEVVDLVGDGQGDLRANAEQLDDVVERLERSGAPPVDVVGYSAGGVVARLWADGEGQGRVRRVVTLGSPQHGTELAGLAAGLFAGSCPVGCRQLQPGSPLLATLNAPAGADREEVPPGVPWLSVYSADDEVVTPPESARLRGAVNVRVQDVCPGIRIQHSALVQDPLSTGLVLVGLSGPEPPPPPGPGDCERVQGLGEVFPREPDPALTG